MLLVCDRKANEEDVFNVICIESYIHVIYRRYIQ
jgi:hypothetical protein